MEMPFTLFLLNSIHIFFLKLQDTLNFSELK